MDQPAVPHDLCRPFILALPISGASVTLISGSGNRLTLESSDEVAARIEELQFELGEGPQWAAFYSGDPILVPDLVHGPNEAWPVFASEISHSPVGAIFAVPMRMGAVTLGVATLYRTFAGGLTAPQVDTALAIASALAIAATQRAILAAEDDAGLESQTSLPMRREVHQATGMIVVQLDTSATVAYARLQAYAFANGRTVEAVAHDVVARTLSFDSMI
jgi:hypothetical protein